MTGVAQHCRTSPNTGTGFMLLRHRPERPHEFSAEGHNRQGCAGPNYSIAYSSNPSSSRIGLFEVLMLTPSIHPSATPVWLVPLSCDHASSSKYRMCHGLPRQLHVVMLVSNRSTRLQVLVPHTLLFVTRLNRIRADAPDAIGYREE